MASRLISSKTALALKQTLAPSASRQLAAGFAAARVQQRQMSTRPDPKVAAESLINMFPGDNLAAKSGSVLVGASIAAFLISKEIYLVDGEVFEMACIFGAYGLWFWGGKDGAVEYFNGKKATIKNVLEQARGDHKAVVQERIQHIGKMSDIVDVTNSLFEMSKEIAKLEAEAYELKQKVNFTHQTKSVLDAWVRHEASVRESQQKDLADSVINKVKGLLANDRTQADILKQSLADIEKIASKA
ncbi:atp4 subunit B of the stator stalk of mitochondrial F1F0 ATP synthase [Geranomyces variabilis]|uniref:ATP synthase subunit 4 n=1 Tax=Geranomyces variabilis TaxID=109894 RepID=A0AAD5TBB0_9FUNG|nr:atp4 subunit B of the stator stalk of mitochondrial F1F0 ATP synthase [Geranomyces variabilis]